jgi:dihydropteroate synthase
MRAPRFWILVERPPETQSPNTQEQLDRVLPIIEKVAREFEIFISVDTSNPQVMQEAVKHGAGMINDQRGLQLPNALATAAKLDVPICLMHFFLERRQPGSSSPAALLTKIIEDFRTIIKNCLAAGIGCEQILIDPGFGQGHYCKNVSENFYLLSHLSKIIDLGQPVLVGWSRKSMVGDVLQAPPEQRLYGSIAAATIAAMQGASVIRVHDVAETMDAIRIVNAFHHEAAESLCR